MKSGVLLFFIFVWFSMPSAQGQYVKHSYRFYESFAVANPECGPDLVQSKALGNCDVPATPGNYIDDLLPCGAKRKVYHTNMNWGLMYPNATGAITDTYTIQMYIKVTDWGTTWARIIDFSNGQSDQGVYFKNQNGSADRCLDFYPNGIAGTCPYFNTSTYYLLTFSRNGQTGIMDVYVDNMLFVSYNDTGGRYVGKAGTPIYIFRDDASVSCESGEANFAYLSFSNKYFSQSDVTTTYNQICFVASINSSADFSVDPSPSCSISKALTIQYTGDIPAPATGYTFEWTWDGGTVLSGSGMGPFSVKWDTPGSKHITLAITGTCGNKIINTKEAEIGNLDLTTSLVEGSCTDDKSTISIHAVNGIAPFQYSIDSINYQTDTVFSVTPATYQVYVKDANNCTINKTVKVNPAENLLVQTIGDTTICEGQQVQLFTTSNVETFAWQPATGLDNATVKDPVANPANTVQYIVTASKDNCITSDTVTITVVPKIIVNATPDTDVTPAIPFQLTAHSPQLDNKPGVSYLWMPPIGLNNPAIANPVAILTSSISYTIKITSEEGCSGTSQVNLNVTPPPSVFVPTAFTPDGDGKNEVLLLVPNRMKSLTYFRIYNRWGQVVFFSNQFDQGWDGRFKGGEPVSGSYVFQIEGINEKDEIIKKNGTVLLIR